MKIYFDIDVALKYSLATCITVYLVNESINGNIGRMSDILCDKNTTISTIYYQLNTNGIQELAKCIDSGLVEITEDHRLKLSDIAKNEILGINYKEVDLFFERLWKLYPVKKGKGKVSQNQKRKLFKIGEPKITECIIRYKKYIEDNNKQEFIMNGSTFFNSGYIDYLDENYCEDSSKKESGFLQKVGL